MLEGRWADASEMRKSFCAGIFLITLCYPVSASITVDLVCDGFTVIVLNNEKGAKEPWSKTYSIKNGVSGGGSTVWEVSDTHLRYSMAPVKPQDPDYAILYESIELKVEINRLSGAIKQLWTFKNKALKNIVGDYRYQIDEGKCSPAKRAF